MKPFESSLFADLSGGVAAWGLGLVLAAFAGGCVHPGSEAGAVGAAGAVDAAAGGKSTGGSASGGNNASGGGASGGTAGTGTAGTGTAGTGTAGTGSGGAGLAVVGDVRWVGRVDASDPSAVKFAWQGAGFVATVTGSEIAVELNTSGGPVYFQPLIDGKAGQRFAVPAGDLEVALGTGLTNGDHLVELYRDSEPSFGVSTFLGFTKGTVKGAPAGTRLLEIVGDSISAGYGDLGSEPHPGWVANPACHQTAENSSWFKTYGAVAGRDLGADVSTIAMSGWGMVRSYGGGSSVLSSVYGNTVGTEPTPAWGFEPKADAVVINLGTNDWSTGDPGTAYETAYLSFLKTVRGHYPDAYIFLTIGPMLGDPELSQAKTRLANVVAAFGDSKVSTFDFGTQDLGPDGSIPTGCDWHPSVATHAAMASTLEAHLRAVLGW